MQRQAGFFLTLIIVAALLAGVFAYPRGFGAKYLPWRLGLDLVGGSHLIYRVDLSGVNEGDRGSVLNGLRDVIERRVNFFGVGEPRVFIAESGAESSLVVELAGVKDVSEAIRQIGETPFLEFKETREVPPKEIGGAPSVDLVATNLSGRYVKGAQISFNSTTQAPEVSISFNEEGAAIFETLTARNIGRPLAILLDGEVISAPIVQQRIAGGEAQITGRFTVPEARQLVERFNAGALPAPITLINQETVSATLGADSMKRAIAAGILGTALVALFMIVYYRKLGFFAALALCMYIAFTLGIFKLTPTFTLTLAGLAGFVLTIGMAVDANVLIFERVKEELARGFSYAAAVHEGFRHAWPSIRDSNTSTIISAIILYFFTSSFVKGFALTLLIGTLVSMFSAITTTRLLLHVFGRQTPFPASPSTSNQ